MQAEHLSAILVWARIRLVKDFFGALTDLKKIIKSIEESVGKNTYAIGDAQIYIEIGMCYTKLFLEKSGEEQLSDIFLIV